jgi:hypothetical protein
LPVRHRQGRKGEYAENSFRKDFTPSEAVAIKQALEPAERVAAKQRQRKSKGRGKKGRGNSPTLKGKALDKVAAAVGKDRKTLAKAEAVVEAAKVQGISLTLSKASQWEQIATQLGVSQSTVTEDLRNLSTTNKSKPTKTTSNPKGAGSPGKFPEVKGNTLDKVAKTVGKDRRTLEPAARSVAQLLPPLGRRACFLNVAISVAINRNLRRQV